MWAFIATDRTVPTMWGLMNKLASTNPSCKRKKEQVPGPAASVLSRRWCLCSRTTWGTRTRVHASLRFGHGVLGIRWRPVLCCAALLVLSGVCVSHGRTVPQQRDGSHCVGWEQGSIRMAVYRRRGGWGTGPPGTHTGTAVSPSHQRLGGAWESSAVWAAVRYDNRRSGPSRGGEVGRHRPWDPRAKTPPPLYYVPRVGEVALCRGQHIGIGHTGLPWHRLVSHCRLTAICTGL